MHCLRSFLRRALEAIGAPGDLPIVIEVPRDPALGDHATPVALEAARRMGRPAMELARELAASLMRHQGTIDSATVAEPGFVNVRYGELYYSRYMEMLGAGELGVAIATRHAGYAAGDAPAVIARAQRTCAAVAGILRHAEASGVMPDPGLPDMHPEHPSEKALIRSTIAMVDIILDDASFPSPARVVAGLSALADAFDDFHENCRIFPERPSLRDSRLRLLIATERMLRAGLKMLGSYELRVTSDE